jgi:hypothetical protein
MTSKGFWATTVIFWVFLFFKSKIQTFWPNYNLDLCSYCQLLSFVFIQIKYLTKVLNVIFQMHKIIIHILSILKTWIYLISNYTITQEDIHTSRIPHKSHPAIISFTRTVLMTCWIMVTMPAQSVAYQWYLWR